MLTLFGYLYGGLAEQRRRWYERRPDARRRLARPVVSVGNLSVGGSGKTPLVAHLAELLLARGERPAVLSRGYRRQRVAEGVVVVRDAERIRAGLAEAGDEPLMLARALAGAIVVVAADRYLAGRLAEARLGATIHLLDDGFQHLALYRDVDLLVLDGEEIDRPQLLPAGRLRERLSAASRADAVLVPESAGDPDIVAQRVGVEAAFRLVRVREPARVLGHGADPLGGEPRALAPGTRVLGVAGIGRPDRFFRDLEAAGLELAGTLSFRDHHPFSAGDVDRIAREASARQAELVVTTEKDAVRLAPHGRPGLPIAWVPLTVRVEPSDLFGRWLGARLAARWS